MKKQTLQIANLKYVAANFAYWHEGRGEALQLWICINPDNREAFIQEGWESDCPKPKDEIIFHHKDEVKTVFGTYTFYDNHGTGTPILALPENKFIPEATVVKFKPN